MRRHFCANLAIITLITCQTSYLPGAEISIASYKNDCQGAVTLTFDDGYRSQAINAKEALDKAQLKGTFFIMPIAMEKRAKSFVTWDFCKELISEGHEIGTHAVVKEKLHEVTKKRLDEIVNGGRKTISEKTDIAPISFALPGGSKPLEHVTEKIYEEHLFIRKPNQFKIATVKGYGNTDKWKWRHKNIEPKLEEHIAKGGWWIATIHAIVGGYRPFDSKEVFQEHCNWLASQSDRIWTAPLGEVGSYLLGRENAELLVKNARNNKAEIVLQSRHKHPSIRATELTIKIAAKAKEASATRDDKELAVQLKDDSILINANPSELPISISWK